MQRIDERSLVAAEKPELVLLDTPELNAETPAHLLDDDITPIARLFARNTGAMPALGAGRDRGLDTAHRWLCADTADLDHRRAEAGIRDRHRDRGDRMRRQRPRLLPATRPARCCGATARSAACAGPACGSAICCEPCEVLPQAVYTGHHSPDVYLDGSGPAISRGLPIDKALAPETLVAFALNGEPLPALHGGPLRLVAPGYPGASFQKWLTRIEVRDREHDGERMRDGHYRMPRAPLRYGEPFDAAQFEIITDMPVKSLITAPRDGFSRRANEPLRIRGHAWSGHTPVEKVELSFDGGAILARGELAPAPDRFAWRRFRRSRSPTRRRARSRSSRAPPTTTAARSHWTACRGIRAAIATTSCHRVRGRIE